MKGTKGPYPESIKMEGAFGVSVPLAGGSDD